MIDVYNINKTLAQRLLLAGHLSVKIGVAVTMVTDVWKRCGCRDNVQQDNNVERNCRYYYQD